MLHNVLNIIIKAPSLLKLEVERKKTLGLRECTREYKERDISTGGIHHGL